MQEDNDPKHTPKSARKWREEKNITHLVWPAQSPDLNPIENVWREMKRYVSLRPIPANENEMWELLLEAWEAIGKPYLDKLLESMPNRMREVIAAKGGPTSY